jgi:hypothetical protein
MADKPFTIIGVNSDQDIGRKDLDHIRNVVKEKSLTWRSFQNTSPEEKISATWNVRGWPTTYLIDKDGVIRYKNLRGDALDEALEELMSEMGQEVSLVGVDHEAEDEAALEAAKKEAEEAAEDADKKDDDDDNAKSDEKSDADGKGKSDKDDRP